DGRVHAPVRGAAHAPTRTANGRLGVAGVAALAQEALELAGDAVPRRDVLVGVAALVLGELLEALDERLDVRIALHREPDLALVVDRTRPPFAYVDRNPDQALELAHERQRGLGVRRGRDVVRDARPEARRRDAAPRARSVQHADDPRRALVAGRGQ